MAHGRPKVGEILVDHDKDNVIFHMITKDNHYDKPRLQDINKFLHVVRDKATSMGIGCMALPHIGCGLDGQNGEMVKPLIVRALQDTNMKNVIRIL